MRNKNIEQILESLKGLAGSGNLLSTVAKGMTDYLLTLEPGDLIQSDPARTIAAPIAYDLWYLYVHDNLMAKYYDNLSVEDQRHKDYTTYISENLSFLSPMTGLRPLKVVRDLKQFVVEKAFDVYDMRVRTEYSNNGIYWINTMAFELWIKGLGAQYPSDGPKGYNPNDYVGYLSFPIGQLGVMEVISLFWETAISGYKFTGVDSDGSYEVKLPPSISDQDKPICVSPPEMFPPIIDSKGTIQPGMNYCFGRHLIDGTYRRSDTPAVPQNTSSSEWKSPYAPIANRDFELFSSEMKMYLEDVKPKLWARYWIHKDDTFPVPGEFVGILCKPIVAPPHVWWFQESTPFVYAGNWVETTHLTSGIVTKVTLEADRTDGGIGNEYEVKIQGCNVTIYPTDFYDYKIGDRVAILKLDSTVEIATKSFTWLDQIHFDETDKDTVITNYLIIPATFYKRKH